MKTFKQILLLTILLVGFSVSVSAQKDGKKTPPKETPPVIFIEKKKGEKPKDEKPKDENKGKKPESFIFNSLIKIEIVSP